MSEINFSTLIGKTLTEIKNYDGEKLTFETTDGETFSLYHWQSCCEDVRIEDIAGDLADLIGTPILAAEEVTSENVNPEGVKAPEYQDSFTWTFYKLRTIKGSVDIRWYGASNGYYSEGVSFERVSAE